MRCVYVGSCAWFRVFLLQFLGKVPADKVPDDMGDRVAMVTEMDEQLRTHNEQLAQYSETLRAQLAALHEEERAARTAAPAPA